MSNYKYNISYITLVLFFFLFALPACKKETVTPAPTPAGYSIIQNFNSLTDAEDSGWVFINNSSPLGATTWQAGDGTLFPGYNTDAAASDYVAIAASCSYPFDANGNFDPNTVISAWMITPILTIKNGDDIIFYTSTTSTPAYIPEHLELRENMTGTDINVGSDSSSVGSFTKIVININPSFIPGGYPGGWTEYEYIINGVTPGTKTRFAFRYYKPINTLGQASYYYQLGYIGIDAFTFNSN